MAEKVEAEALRRARSPQGIAAADISRAIVRLMHRYTGRGPTKARTTLNTNLAAVVLHEALTRGELNLVAAGQSDAVLAMRRTYFETLRADAIREVEEVIHRRVTSALSDVDPENNVATFVFVLEPRPETGVATVVEIDDPGIEPNE